MKLPFHSEFSGTIFVVAALLTWGINPIYFKSVQHVSPSEILCHRIIWSVVFLMLFIIYKKQLNKII
jgi:chloramphenicol-sensitive protein RarD